LDDQPLDLSATSKKSASCFSGKDSGSRRFGYGSQGISPASPDPSDDEEQPDVEEHFRRSGMILDLSSRK